MGCTMQLIDKDERAQRWGQAHSNGPRGPVSISDKKFYRKIAKPGVLYLE